MVASLMAEGAILSPEWRMEGCALIANHGCAAQMCAWVV